MWSKPTLCLTNINPFCTPKFCKPGQCQTYGTVLVAGGRPDFIKHTQTGIAEHPNWLWQTNSRICSLTYAHALVSVALSPPKKAVHKLIVLNHNNDNTRLSRTGCQP